MPATATDRYRNGSLPLYGGDNPRTTGLMNVADAMNAGYKINPWMPNSGVGPGTRGYMGSGHSYGYSFDKQGTADDYIRQNGGLSAPRPSLLNELYLNQPGVTMGAFDKLQNQRAMDHADPIGGFYADQAGVAHGQGEYDKSALFHAMLQDHLAQRQAAAAPVAAAAPFGIPAGITAAGGVAAPAPAYHAPGETRYDQGGNLWRWNQASGHGDLINRAPTFAETYQMRQDAAAPQTSWESQDPGEGTLHTQFGDATVTQGQPGSATFTGGHGMNLGFGNMPGIYANKTQSARDFFQDAANRQGENKFAVPAPGYHGVKSNAWSAYDKAMKAKNSLGKK